MKFGILRKVQKTSIIKVFNVLPNFVLGILIKIYTYQKTLRPNIASFLNRESNAWTYPQKNALKVFQTLTQKVQRLISFFGELNVFEITLGSDFTRQYKQTIFQSVFPYRYQFTVGRYLEMRYSSFQQQDLFHAYCYCPN